MRTFAQLSIIVVLSAAAAGATYLVKGAPSRRLVCDPATLKPDEVCLGTIRNPSSYLWVDARLRKDWMATGLPGSILWNLDGAEDMQAFEAETATRLMETPRVIVYCGDENCGISRQVADRIKRLGLAEEVHVLRGGWRALKEAGLTRNSSPGT